MLCPCCKREVYEDVRWPVEVDGEIVEGGCQECWEKECDRTFWDAVDAGEEAGS